MAKAIDNVRKFAGKDSGGALDTPTNEKLDAVLFGDYQGVPEGVIDFGDMQGLTPTDPITVAFSDIEGEIVAIVEANEVDNLFREQRPDASPTSAEFIMQRADKTFIRALASNAMIMKQLPLIRRALVGYSTVTALVIGVEVRGQVNKAYGFSGTRGRLVANDLPS